MNVLASILSMFAIAAPAPLPDFNISRRHSKRRKTSPEQRAKRIERRRAANKRARAERKRQRRAAL